MKCVAPCAKGHRAIYIQQGWSVWYTIQDGARTTCPLWFIAKFMNNSDIIWRECKIRVPVQLAGPVIAAGQSTRDSGGTPQNLQDCLLLIWGFPFTRWSRAADAASGTGITILSTPNFVSTMGQRLRYDACLKPYNAELFCIKHGDLRGSSI